MSDLLPWRDEAEVLWYNELYRGYAARLMGTFLSKGLDYQAATDVLHRTFLKLWLAIERTNFASKDHMLRYLRVAARNNSNLARRRMKKDSRRLGPLERPKGWKVSEALPAGYQVQPVEPPDTDERTELARGALGTLSDRQREIFIAKDQEEMSSEEIAAHFGISVESVKTTLAVGRAKIRLFGLAHGVPMCVPKKPRGRSK